MVQSSPLSILLVSSPGHSLDNLREQLREAFPGTQLYEAATESMLREQLSSHRPGVTLCNLSAPAVPPEAICRIQGELKTTSRLVALGEEDSTPDIVSVMSRGARDFVNLKDLLHLKLVIARELEILPLWCERNAQALQTRADLEPSALMNGEEVEWCNEAFAGLLGRSSPAQVARRAIWLCIDGDDHHPLKRALQNCAGGQRLTAPIGLGAVAPDGRHLRLSLTLSLDRSDGRNLVRIKGARSATVETPATQAAGAKSQINVETLKRLRAAVAANGLAMAVQPISGLAASIPEASKLDVLIRIKDEVGELAAANFMREASAAGLLKTLDQWVVRSACALSARNAAFSDSLFFLRIARQTLQDPATPAFVRDALALCGMKASQLSFELSEAEFASLPKEEAMALLSLKKAGCRLTLSQFGMRTDSLYMLQRLPLNYIKLDTQITGEVATSEGMRKLLREIVACASARAIGTISTRVSDATTLAELWKLGVHFVQGHYVQEPEIVVGQK